MGPPLSEVLEDPRVVEELLANPESFSFKVAPTIVLTMVSWPTHTRLSLEDMNSPTVLAGIPTNFPIAGPMSEVLKILTTTMNFTYLQIVPPDVSFGTPYPNGSWSGMIRQIMDKKADVGLGPFQVIHSRSQVVDYTFPVSFDILSIMAARGIGATNPWGFLMPFAPSLWTTFFVALIFMCLVHLVLETHLHEDSSVLIRFGRALFDYCQPPMGQAMCNRIKGWQRPLIGSWVLVALLVNSSYDGTLRSMMSLRHIPHPYQTLQDVIKATDKKIIIEHRTSFTDIMSRVPSGDVRILDDAGKAGRYVDLKMRDFMVYSHLVERGDHIQIFDMTTASRYFALHFTKTGSCRFYFGREKFIPTMYAMTMQKGSPLRAAMTIRLLRIFEAGLYVFWMKNGVANYTACSNPPTKVPSQDPIGFDSIWGLAVIWSVGMGLAFITLILELLVANCCSSDDIRGSSSPIQKNEGLN